MMVHAPPPPSVTQLSLAELIAVASAQPILDEHDEETLIRRARQGEAEAREALVMGNLRVAIDEAIRTRGLGMPQRTLVPMGVSTLLEAIRSYDPVVHGPFSSHVRKRVRLAMRASFSIS